MMKFSNIVEAVRQTSDSSYPKDAKARAIRVHGSARRKGKTSAEFFDFTVDTLKNGWEGEVEKHLADADVDKVFTFRTEVPASKGKGNDATPEG